MVQDHDNSLAGGGKNVRWEGFVEQWSQMLEDPMSFLLLYREINHNTDLCTNHLTGPWIRTDVLADIKPFTHTSFVI